MIGGFIPIPFMPILFIPSIVPPFGSNMFPLREEPTRSFIICEEVNGPGIVVPNRKGADSGARITLGFFSFFIGDANGPLAGDLLLC